ncbi:hypothetical protein ABT158_49730 [Nonomuraea sp. NPDC001636]
MVVLAQHPQDGGGGGMLAFLGAEGDDEFGGDVAQTGALAA